MNYFLKIVRWTIIALATLVGFAIAFILYEISWMPNYDDADPRYQTLVGRLAEIHQSLTIGDRTEHDIDLSKLNDGKWTTACVFGGYNNPLEEIEARRANITAEDRKQLLELGRAGFRLAQVEEFELMIAYVDTKNDAHFVHFQSGFGSGGQHFEKCITKPQTVIDLFDDI
jgi:hypothetical protein